MAKYKPGTVITVAPKTGGTPEDHVVKSDDGHAVVTIYNKLIVKETAVIQEKE
jgi:hypothetical protein